MEKVFLIPCNIKNYGSSRKLEFFKILWNGNKEGNLPQKCYRSSGCPTI
jgi:hypothetical protein